MSPAHAPQLSFVFVLAAQLYLYELAVLYLKPRASHWKYRISGAFPHAIVMSRSLLRVVTTHNNCSTEEHNAHALQQGTGCLKNLSFTELWVCILETLLLQATGTLRTANLRIAGGTPVCNPEGSRACSRRDSSIQIHNSVKLSFFKHPVASFLFFN